jgi:glycosyltransferase involved in cell wall biosynthesis
MSREFVSVVTPTYNRRKFLPILIHLYKMQTYPANRRELVILDDSPTSNEDIIPKNDPSIRYYYTPEKMTLGEKRNKLNELAKGDIIVCFDDDDYHYPERISYSITRMNSEKANIAGCSCLDIYYTDIKKIYEFGPYGRNHGTNGTFAYRKNYIKNHKHDPTKNAQEEPSFTNNFTEHMALLNPDKVILCISHDSNTYDKRNLLKQEKREETYVLKKKIPDKKYLEFLKQITEESMKDKEKQTQSQTQSQTQQVLTERKKEEEFEEIEIKD